MWWTLDINLNFISVFRHGTGMIFEEEDEVDGLQDDYSLPPIVEPFPLFALASVFA
jgi:hypothetical protein